MENRMKQMYLRQKTGINPADSPPSPKASPRRHSHVRSGSVGVSNERKAQTKAAAQRLAAVMAHKPSDENDDDDDDDCSNDYTSGGIGVIGLAGSGGGGRAMRSRSRSPTKRHIPQKRSQMITTMPVEDDNDEDDDYGLVSGKASIGLAGGRAMKSRTPVNKAIPQKHKQEMVNQQADTNNHENYDYGKGSIGHVGGKSMRSPSPLTKTTPQRHRQEIAHQPVNEDENDDYNMISLRASTGLADRRSMRSPSPMAKNAPWKHKQETVNQTGNEDKDEHYGYDAVTDRVSIGLAGGRSMRSPSSLTKTTAQKYKQDVMNQPSDEGKNEDYQNSREHSSTASIGLASRKSMWPHPTTDKSTAQRQQQETANQSTDEDNDENYDYDLVSGKASIGLAGGRTMHPPSPNMKTTAPKHTKPVVNQASEEENDVDDLPYVSKLASGKITIGQNGGRMRQQSSPMVIGIPAVTTSACSNQEELPSAHSTSGAQSSLSMKSVEQPSSSSLSSIERPSQSIHSVDSAHSTTAGGSSQSTKSIEQPPFAQSISAVKSNVRVKTVSKAPSAVPKSLRPASSANISDASVDNQKNRRLSVDLGSVNNFSEADNLRSASALQDEIDMLQEENDGLLEKLQLAEERCEEAEARARQLEKQVANFGEGATLEARLLNRKEAALQQREAALKVAAQSPGCKTEEISALKMEAETARDEAISALELLQQVEDESRSLRNLTQRLILTKEEMEELVLKRCWLARYWNLCLQHGIHSEIAKAKYDYWSSFAPLPVEIVLATGQRAKEEKSSESNGAEERQKVLQDLTEISGEENIESMLLVEKGLRELALLKVEDALALAMAQIRCSNNLKSDELKLPSEGQFEAFELSKQESEDIQFKQAWLAYFWRRALNHGLEPDIAYDRLQFWIDHSSRSSSSHDAVEVERGLAELRKLGLETQLWQVSRKGLEQDSKSHIESDF